MKKILMSTKEFRDLVKRVYAEKSRSSGYNVGGGPVCEGELTIGRRTDLINEGIDILRDAILEEIKRQEINDAEFVADLIEETKKEEAIRKYIKSESLRIN